MSKTPANIQKQLARIEAIKKGIGEGKTQVDLSLIFGVKKSYIGWLLGKYGHSWKSLKKEYGFQHKIPVTKNSSKSKSMKPTGSQNRVNTGKGKIQEKPMTKSTDININTEEYFVDPNEFTDILPDAGASVNEDNTNTEIIQNAVDITEELYQAALLEHVKDANTNGGIKIQTLTEIRNYLDKTAKLATSNAELDITVAEFSKIEKDLNPIFENAAAFIQTPEFQKTTPKKHHSEVESKT